MKFDLGIKYKINSQTQKRFLNCGVKANFAFKSYNSFIEKKFCWFYNQGSMWFRR